MFATWNVRTLSETSKLAQVAREMYTYKLEILGLAATRWVGSGDEQLQFGHYFMFFGNNAERVNGVGIIISSKCRKNSKISTQSRKASLLLDSAQGFETSQQFSATLLRIPQMIQQKIHLIANLKVSVCCGVRGRALASHTDVRGFEPQCGGRLSSLTC